MIKVDTVWEECVLNIKTERDEYVSNIKTKRDEYVLNIKTERDECVLNIKTERDNFRSVKMIKMISKWIKWNFKTILKQRIRFDWRLLKWYL